MKDKIVIDTNIFIDAWFDNDYACQEIMQLIYDRRILLLFSQETIGELIYITKNFARHTFHSEEYRIIFLSHLMDIFYHSHSINTMNKDSVPNLSRDEYDQMFIECAVLGKADYCLTKDMKSGLTDLAEYEGVRFIRPEEYLSLI